MRRLALVLLLVAACSGGGSKAADTTTTAPTTTASVTTIDPKAADLALVKAMWRANNSAWKTSNAEGLRVGSETAWPQGEWTPEMWFCSNQQTRTFIEVIVDDASFELDPTFVLPAGSYPGAGQTPPGRLYIMHITSTVDGVSSQGEAHSAVMDDGKAHWFPIAC